MGNILVGIILIVIGLALIVNAYHLNHHVLFLGWAEQKWGPGSGTLAYKVIGVALIIFSFFIISGLFDPFKDPLTTLSSKQGVSTSTQLPTVSTPIPGAKISP